MILGRNPALWLALITAGLNAVIALHLFSLDTGQIAALNALALAVIGVIANEADPTTAGTFAMTTHPPVTTSSTMTTPNP